MPSLKKLQALFVLTISIFIALAFFASMPSYSAAQVDNQIVFSSDRDGNLEIYSINLEDDNLQRLTFNEAQDIDPAWSPNKQQIAFVSNRDGNYNIYIMNADGSNQHRITPNDSNYYAAPAWSPDGQQLALVSDRTGNLEIHVMGVNGDNLHPLTDHPAEDNEPSWSPDGQYILFSSYRDDFSEIYIVNASGGSPRRLTTDAGVDNYAPAWSPDGQHIVFVTAGNGYSEIYVMGADGSNQRVLLSVDEAFLGSPTWSPDGQFIAYDLTRNNEKAAIQIVDVNGQSVRQLTSPDSEAKWPSWSTPKSSGLITIPGMTPRGSRIVFIRDLDLYIQNTTGDTSPRLLISTGETYEPDISGDRIVYSSARNNRYLDIFLYDLISNREYQLTTHDAQDRHPSFSPDGQRVAFASDRSGNWDIYIINSDGSNLVQVTYASSFEYAPTWSPDGRFLAYQSDRDGNDEIYIQDLDTGNVRRLTDAADSMVGALWSPDGNYIACYAYVDTPYVAVADANTGAITTWYTGIADEWLSVDILLYHRKGPDGISSVYTLNIHSGEEQLLIQNASWAASD